MTTGRHLAATPVQTVRESIEISGWDAEGQFFVEITGLEAGDASGATALLRHRAGNGSLVFVRVLQENYEGASQKSHPTGHEAQIIPCPGNANQTKIRLKPCRSRTSRHQGDETSATRI